MEGGGEGGGEWKWKGMEGWNENTHTKKIDLILID